MWRWLLYCTPHSLRLDLKQAHRPHWRRWGKPSGPCPPKLRHILPFVACEAVSQSKCCCSLKVKVFGPPKHFGAGYAIDRPCRKEFHLFSMWFHAVWRKELLRFKEPMRENKFECFLLVMHDKIVHNPKICLELRAIQWPPFNPSHGPIEPWGSISTTLGTTGLRFLQSALIVIHYYVIIMLWAKF